MSDDEEFKDAVDVAMTTEPHPLPVIPSQHLASSMGVSNHRVQVMKASFFSDGDDRAQGQQPFSFGVTRPPMFATTPTSTSLLGERPLLRRSGNDMHTPSRTLSSRLQRSSARGSPSPLLSAPGHYPHPAVSSLQAQASVIMAKHNLSQLVERGRSMTTDKTHNVADAGLTMGRTFRVGWGPKWTLAHSGFQISHSKDSKSTGLFSSTSDDEEGLPLRVVVEQVHIGPPKRQSLTPPSQVTSATACAATCIHACTMYSLTSFSFRASLSSSWPYSWNTQPCLMMLGLTPPLTLLQLMATPS